MTVNKLMRNEVIATGRKGLPCVRVFRRQWGRGMDDDPTKKPGIGRHRVKSPRLSLRETEAQAQQDLDAYARVRGWRQA